MNSKQLLSIGGLMAFVACGLERDMAAPKQAEPMVAPEEAYVGDEAPPPPPASAAPAKAARKRGRAEAEDKPVDGKMLGLVSRGGGAMGGFAADTEATTLELAEKLDSTKDAPAARSWFPETFVFAPMIETDERGLATHEVRVPDRLTTWRILALAHSREGAQAGAVTSFLGTLPVYLDPVLPAQLAVGDQLEVPIQLVNTTDKPIDRDLELKAEGGQLTANRERVSIPARGSTTRRVTLNATRPGTLRFSAALTGEDAVLREVQVVPTGRPVHFEVGGTLAAPRSPKLERPADLELDTARLRLSVFPGALAVLRSELAAATGRSSLADDAYLLLLSTQAETLLRALDAAPDHENLRRLRITATQRAMRHNRASAEEAALLFLPGAIAAKDEPVLERLGRRLLDVTSRAQRGDGTFLGGPGWTLQRLLVATAEGISALEAAATDEEGQRRHTRARLLARGALERSSARIDDPYTAAALLAADLPEAALADKLRTLVRDALETREDGTKWLVPKKTTERADGTQPSEVEATALAVLALAKDPSAAQVLPDLGAALLGSYRVSGFGDGRTNLVALKAVLTLFKDPLPAKVAIKLYGGEQVLAEGQLEGAALKEVLVLEAPLGAASKAELRVVAEPPVPGLGYQLELRGYVPWRAEPEGGLSLAVEAPSQPRVGRAVEARLRATSPGGAALVIHHAIPAGVLPDEPSLEALVEAGTLERFEKRDGEVSLFVPARSQGQVADIRYRLLPTLAGRLSTSASRIELADGRAERHVPPSRWNITR